MGANRKLAEVIVDKEVPVFARSAIEFIVETARPDEVTYICDEDYYNTHLWHSYLRKGRRARKRKMP